MKPRRKSPPHLSEAAIAKILELHGRGLSTHEICYLINRDNPPRNVFHEPLTSVQVRRILKREEVRSSGS
jgi:hypothetical protein